MIPMPGATELIIILVIVLVLFGPSQLPKIGKMLGQTSRSIRDGMNSIEGDEKTEKKAKAKKADEEADDEE